MTDRIPQETLDAAHRRLCRQVAAQIIHAMSMTDIPLETIDSRLGWEAGTASATIYGLINGNTKLLRELSDLSVALGAVPFITLEPKEQAV